jgi:N-acyl-D-amino-acid deacylase
MEEERVMLDVVIRNAYMADGTGNPGYVADLAVAGDRIAAIGRLPAAQAKTTIDAAGKVLCPGFIDTHLHSEVELLAGKHTAGVQMGVTTEFICPDGMGFACLPPDLLADYWRYIFGIYVDSSVITGWRTVQAYLDAFTGRCHNNIVSMAPHGAIRLAACGWKTGPATPAEMDVQKRLVREWMDAGAVGLNTGLGYAPAMYADVHEIAELCKVTAPYGGVYAAHMRNYGPERDASIAETVTISREGGVPVHIDHFGGTPEIYASAEAAREQGIDITWDAYPYMAGCTLLSYVLPPEMFARGTQALLDDLRRPALRRELAAHLDAAMPPDAPPHFAFVALDKNKWMEGKRVREVWRQSGKAFVDFYCDLLLEESLAPLLIYPWPDEPAENERRLRNTLTHPLQMVSTDGVYVGSAAHPRGYGTYPRILGRYVRDLKWLRLEDAIRRMTSFPAARFGLDDRGLLRKGMAADLVIFDPTTVIDRATYESPRLPPEGIEHVFVNGQAVVSDGQLTGKRPGVVIRES